MIEKIKQSPIGRRILVMLLGVLSCINQIIPKNKKAILFYSTRDYLEDNTEAIYSWLKKNGFDKEYKFYVCIPKQKTKLPFYDYTPIGTIEGVYRFLTSKYMFYSFGDFRIRPSKKQMVINQWHGTGTKKSGKQLNDINYQKERLDNFTYLLASSEYMVSGMAEQFGCSESKILIMGSARNDYLVSTRETLTDIGINKLNYNKLILWMPTFRTSNDKRFDNGKLSEETLLPVLSTYKDIDRINKKLKETGILLVIKIHPMASFKQNNYENIKIMTNDDIIPKGVKLYEFVKEFDALITDYSSIFPDFLILDRPIGFTMDDYEEFEKKRGFFFDNFKEYMPGHHMYTIEDIEKFICDIRNENDEYKEKRAKVLPVFWKYPDGNNCKRLVETIGLTL